MRTAAAKPSKIHDIMQWSAFSCSYPQTEAVRDESFNGETERAPLKTQVSESLIDIGIANVLNSRNNITYNKYIFDRRVT